MHASPLRTLRSNGIRVQAAAEWAREQFYLEALTDFVVRGVQHLRKQPVKSWFETPDKFPPGIGHIVHGMKMWKLAFGDSLSRIPYEMEKRRALCAKALRIKPSDSEKFQTTTDIFWTVTLLLTDEASILLFGAKHEAAYDGRYTHGFIAFPVYRSKQMFGASLGAEGTSSVEAYPISHQSVLHEMRHAFQDYENNDVHQQSRRLRAGDADDPENAERAYQLRPNEVDARLAEFTRMLTFAISDKLKLIAQPRKPKGEERYYGGLKPHLDWSRENSLPEDARRMLLDSYNEHKQEAALLFSNFARFRDFALTRFERKHGNLYKFAYTGDVDGASANARMAIETHLRRLYDELLQRYRNLIPRLKENV